jgi:hypothetical protein
VSECYIYIIVVFFLFRDISIRALGGGIEIDIVNAIIALVEPFIKGDVLGFVEDKMKSVLAEVLVDFDIREIFNS